MSNRASAVAAAAALASPLPHTVAASVVASTPRTPAPAPPTARPVKRGFVYPRQIAKQSPVPAATTTGAAIASGSATPRTPAASAAAAPATHTPGSAAVKKRLGASRRISLAAAATNTSLASPAATSVGAGGRGVAPPTPTRPVATHVSAGSQFASAAPAAASLPVPPAALAPSVPSTPVTPSHGVAAAGKLLTPEQRTAIERKRVTAVALRAAKAATPTASTAAAMTAAAAVAAAAAAVSTTAPAASPIARAQRKRKPLPTVAFDGASARSGSIAQRMEHAQRLIHALTASTNQMSRVSDSDTAQLSALTEKWTVAAQDVLSALLQKSSDVSDTITSMPQLLSAFKIDPALVRYDEREDCFLNAQHRPL